MVKREFLLLESGCAPQAVESGAFGRDVEGWTAVYVMQVSAGLDLK